MKTSESITNITKAFIKAQKEMRNPEFDKTNSHLRNRYASLAAVRSAVLPALNNNGIAVTQHLHKAESGIVCETILLHESGEWMSSEFLMGVGRGTPQEYGAVATYARRYSLQSIAGVVGEEDDDGEAPSAQADTTELMSDLKRRKDELATAIRKITIPEAEKVLAPLYGKFKIGKMQDISGISDISVIQELLNAVKGAT